MARYKEPTEEELQRWKEWVTTKPKVIQEAVAVYELDPWKLYRIKETGHVGLFYSLTEPNEKSPEVTITVTLLNKLNTALAFERNVFGLRLDEVEECEYPTQPCFGYGLTPEDTLFYGEVLETNRCLEEHRERLIKIHNHIGAINKMHNYTPEETISLVRVQVIPSSKFN